MKKSFACGYLRIKGLTDVSFIIFDQRTHRSSHTTISRHHSPPSHTTVHVYLALPFLALPFSHAASLHLTLPLTLVQEFPELTTFFEAEIVGPRHSFLTRKWDADEQVDRQHWMKFPAFRQYEHCFNDDNFQYDFWNKNFLFMRWKGKFSCCARAFWMAEPGFVEQFLVPDHKVRSINGASFAGFYYACLDLSEGTIMGFYYHQNSEWFQYLNLKHQPENAFSSYEFR